MQPPESNDGQEAEQPRSEPPKKRPGRPRKTEEQREAEKERRIPTSFQGRLKFRPGDKHALDVEFKEARNWRALIVEEIGQINRQLVELGAQDDPSAAISQEEKALQAFLWDTYKEHKHRDHIIASFLAMRRKRLYAKLQAAYTALEVVKDLLTPDDTMLVELRRALHLEEPPIPATQEESDEAEAQNDDEPVIQQDQEGDKPQITQRHIYGDAAGLREQLTTFDQRVKEIRSAISVGNGWFEEFYVKKWHINPEAVPYIKRKEPIPEDMPLFVPYLLGPYLKYRWRETGHGRIYTISMGRIPDDELESARQWAEIQGEVEGQDSSEPWPHL